MMGKLSTIDTRRDLIKLNGKAILPSEQRGDTIRVTPIETPGRAEAPQPTRRWNPAKPPRSGGSTGTKYIQRYELDVVLHRMGNNLSKGFALMHRLVRG